MILKTYLNMLLLGNIYATKLLLSEQSNFNLLITVLLSIIKNTTEMLFAVSIISRVVYDIIIR
mgnify:CR=1 FL=1